MRIFNRYIATLAISAAIINIFLAIVKQNDLSVYFITDVIAYLIITLLYIYLNPKARRALNAVSIVLFSSFIVIVAIKVLEILSK